MRFYTGQHRFYCGIDLHARSMHICILDQAGEVVFDRNLPCRPETFLRAVAPFRDGLIVGVECLFAWYWVADLCRAENIAFVLGHALYMKAIHGGKAKNDKIDAGKIARLLRGGTFPLAYAYPPGMRETRDLLRRRTYLVRKRAELLTHLQILNAQYNLAPFPQKLSFAANRAEMNIAERFSDTSVQKSAVADLALVDRLDEPISELELYLVRTTKVDDVQTYHRLQTIPGVGKVLALILLYEMHEVERFDHTGQFLPYARLVRCAHESANKKVGSGGKKIGNAHLRWVFAEAACLFLRSSERAKRWKQKQAALRGDGKALAILGARLARAVYRLLRKREAFDEERFWNGTAARGRTGSFYVPSGGLPCRELICAKLGRDCAWPRCWNSSASPHDRAGATRCGDHAPCIGRTAGRADRLRRIWGKMCGTVLPAERATMLSICGSPLRGKTCMRP